MENAVHELYMNDRINQYPKVNLLIRDINDKKRNNDLDNFSYNYITDYFNSYITDKDFGFSETDCQIVKNKIYDIYFPKLKLIFKEKISLDNYINEIYKNFVAPLANSIHICSGKNYDTIYKTIINTCKGTNLRLDPYNPAYNDGDILSTRILKALGYQGIDVRGVTGLDNSSYGSVIFDI